MHNWNTFDAHTSHGQRWTHKIHHDLDLGETVTFPLIIFFMPSHGANIQMSFCPRFANGDSQNGQTMDSHDFYAYNFVCRLLIEMRFQAKLYFHRKLFNDMWHATWMQRNKGNSFLMTEGQIDNLIFNLFFDNNFVFLNTQMSHASPF